MWHIGIHKLKLKLFKKRYKKNLCDMLPRNYNLDLRNLRDSLVTLVKEAVNPFLPSCLPFKRGI